MREDTPIVVPGRRRAIVLVSPEILLSLCKMTGPAIIWVSKDALPDDASLVGAYYDIARDVWQVVVESASFAEVGDGATYPELSPPEFTRREVDAPAPPAGEGAG